MSVSTNYPGFIKKDADNFVYRRFSDFLWLQEKLQSNFPGAILPPLPEKQAVGRFSPELIEMRRYSLEKFLARLVTFTEYVNDPAFKNFLLSDEIEFNKVKESTNKDKSNLASALVFSMKDMFQSSGISKSLSAAIHKVKQMPTSNSIASNLTLNEWLI